MDNKKIKLYFCAINSERWWQLKDVINNIKDSVDYVITVFGGLKDDGTVSGFDNLSGNKTVIYNKQIEVDETLNLQDYKYHLCKSVWDDNFPKQRQRYVDVVGKIRSDDDSWIVVSDSDEFFSKRLIDKLRSICQYANDKGYDCITIRSRGETRDRDDNVIHYSYDDFWKPLIYKYNPNRIITAVTPDGKEHNVHEGFSIPFNKVLQLPSNHKDDVTKEIVYYHVKYDGEVWERGFRNFFAGGGGPNLGELQPLWKPFVELVKYCAVEDGFGEINTSMDLNNYLKKGNLNFKLKEWFFQYAFEGVIDRPEKLTVQYEVPKYFDSPSLSETETWVSEFSYDDSLAEKKFGKRNYDGSSEVREGFKYYFKFLHPEEMPEVFKKHKEWDV